MEKKTKKNNLLLQVIQGALIGLGAVLPGISGGVLCVVFGIYQPLMAFLADPLHKWRSLKDLWPVLLGVVLGFLGIAKLLGFLLERYEAPSVCVFVGLIAGMLPSLLREAGEQGRSKASWVSMGVAFVAVLGLLIALKVVQVAIAPNVGWFLFCGFCMALSIIVPGMSFSTLLMPLGLYQPFVDGIGSLNFGVLIPAGIGVVVTMILLAKGVDTMMKKHYSVMFHAIIGVVIAATIIIVPFASFATGAVSCIVNVVCLVGGVIAALALDKFNQKIRAKG